jgi:hypothetical protein
MSPDQRTINPPLQTAIGGKRVHLQILDFPSEEFDIKVKDELGDMF